MAQRETSRAGSVRWVRQLIEATSPIFLLDGKRRLIVFNRGCTEWTGWTEADVIGQTCDYVTEADAHSPQAVLAACAPPAEVWRGDHVRVPYHIPHRTRAPQAGCVQFEPILGHEREVTLVIGRFHSGDPPASVAAASPAQSLHAELAALRQQVRSRYGENSVIAQSPSMRRSMARLTAARGSMEAVLFVGEPGTGREYLARLLHGRGPQSKQAFVPVDCLRTESIDLKRILKQLKDERHEREALRPGTLFLRDIDAVPRDVQERLAEWLSSRQESDTVRVMGATSRDLNLMMEHDSFHRELFFLLTTTWIDVPPLRQRSEDLLPLAQYLLEEENRHSARQLSGFQPEAIEALRRYNWPGNVAELRSVVRSALEHTTGSHVELADFPLAFRAGEDAQRLGPQEAFQLLPLETVLAEAERTHIQAALKFCRRNLTKTAERLGMSRPKLYRRLESLGLLPQEDAEG